MIRILNLVDTERIEETIIGTSCNSAIEIDVYLDIF